MTVTGDLNIPSRALDVTVQDDRSSGPRLDPALWVVSQSGLSGLQLGLQQRSPPTREEEPRKQKHGSSLLCSRETDKGFPPLFGGFPAAVLGVLDFLLCRGRPCFHLAGVGSWGLGWRSCGAVQHSSREQERVVQK